MRIGKKDLLETYYTGKRDLRALGTELCCNAQRLLLESEAKSARRRQHLESESDGGVRV